MKLNYIQLRGEDHPLCYNLYAVEKICDVFGGLDEMSEALTSGTMAQQMKAISDVITILLDGGRAYCAEMGIELPKVIKNPSALIDVSSPEAVQAIFATINGDRETTIEVASKNVVAAQES